MGYQQALKRFRGPVIPATGEAAVPPKPSPEANLAQNAPAETGAAILEDSPRGSPNLPEGMGECATVQEIRDLQQKGIPPKSFTKRVVCAICGPVLEETWVDDNPKVCRWCRGNHKGKGR